MEVLIIPIMMIAIGLLLLCYGLYDDILERAVVAYEVRKGWNPDEKPSVTLQLLVWIRMKTMD